MISLNRKSSASAIYQIHWVCVSAPKRPKTVHSIQFNSIQRWSSSPKFNLQIILILTLLALLTILITMGKRKRGSDQTHHDPPRHLSGMPFLSLIIIMPCFCLLKCLKGMIPLRPYRVFLVFLVFSYVGYRSRRWIVFVWALKFMGCHWRIWVL